MSFTFLRYLQVFDHVLKTNRNPHKIVFDQFQNPFICFQLFKRIWPTRSSHNKYLSLFDSVPYSEKLMGRPPTILFEFSKPCVAETFEMFYGGNREAGRAVVNSYCKAKNHLQVPKPEQLLLPKPDISLNLPPLKMPPQPKPCVPVQFQI